MAKKTEDFLHDLWLWKCGKSRESNKIDKPLVLKDLYRTEWSSEFERYMRNRLVQGAFRYGRMNRQQPVYDYTTSIEKRLKLYRETGNREYLVDIANLCMVEFVTNPNKPFDAIDDGTHAQVK